MRVWLAPNAYERRYRRFLAKTVAQVRREFLARLGNVIRLQKANPKFFEDYDNPEDPDGMAVAKQSDEVAFLIAGLVGWWAAQLPTVRGTMRGYFQQINIYNDNEFRQVVKSATGITLPRSTTLPYAPSLVSPTSEIINRFGQEADVFRQEPYLDGIEKNWLATQETYIDRTAREFISNSELAVRNALATSVAASFVNAAINKGSDLTEVRVRKFGEDQVNRLNAQLTRLRSESIGAKSYIWETRRDERVRGNPTGLYPNAKPSHFHRQGEIFLWAKPPEGGHPAEASGCRCRAIIRLTR